MKFITKYIVSSNVIASLELWQESITRSDILQGQALFRGVKQPRRCLVILNNFEKFSFPSIETRATNVVRNAGCARSRYTLK